MQESLRLRDIAKNPITLGERVDYVRWADRQISERVVRCAKIAVMIVQEIRQHCSNVSESFIQFNLFNRFRLASILCHLVASSLTRSRRHTILPSRAYSADSSTLSPLKQLTESSRTPDHILALRSTSSICEAFLLSVVRIIS